MNKTVAYLGSRLVQAAITLVIVGVSVFLLTSVLGDPVAQLLPRPYTQEQYDQLQHVLGYDRPLVTQFGDFALSALHGDFGTSIVSSEPASHVLMSRLPSTLRLAIPAFVFAIVIGIPVGFYAGYRPGTLVDRVAAFLATLGQSAPTFVVGILLIQLFALQLGLLPVSGAGGSVSLILPVVTLGVGSLAVLVRLSRSGMRDVMARPFIVLARSKGMSEWEVVARHAARNAILPIFAFAGMEFSVLLTGSVITESVFGIGGAGQLALQSVQQGDRAVVLAVVMYGAVLFVALSLITDLCYSVIDPQVRLVGERA